LPVLATMVVEYVAETSGLGNAVTALAALGVAAAGVAAVSVKMAGDFEQGVTRLKTGAGDVTDNMATMGKGILATSVATGVLTNGAEGLNSAMYLIISSGQRGGQALDTLKVASEGAQIEQANVVEVANTLSGVMTNYGTKTFNATQYMNGLITAVQQGKITLEDLAVSMGPVDPIAQSLGISFNDMAAAMTTQTNAMIPAARAATGLRFMMMALENPTGKAKDEMKLLGLNSVAVADEMKVSLPGALQMIADAAKKVGPEGSVPFNRAVADMVGGLRSLSTFSALTGDHMKDFTKNSALILDAMQKNKNAVLGWETAQSNFNIKMDQAKAAVASVAIQLGTLLLPALGNLLTAITPLIVAFGSWVTSGKAAHDIMDKLKPIIDYLKPKFEALGTALQHLGQVLLPLISNTTFWHIALTILTVAIGLVTDALTLVINIVTSVVQWFEKNKLAADALKAVLLAAAFVIGVPLVIAFGAWAVAALAAGAATLFAMWPVLLAIGIIALIILAIMHWGDIMNWIGWLIGTVCHAIGDFFTWLFHFLIGGSVIPDIVNGAISWFTNLLNSIGNIFNNIVSTIKNVWNTIVSDALSAGANICKAIGTGITNAIHFVTDAVTNVTSWISAHLPHSPAKVGPLVGLQQQGTEISNQIAQGMLAGTPLLTGAMNNLTKPISLGLKGTATTGTPLQGGNHGDTYITITLDGKDITNSTMKRVQKELRGHGLKK